MSVDNPYYFYNEKSPKTPDSSSKGFSFFKRRSSKGSSSSSKVTSPQRTRPINSATLSSDASILGSPRGSLGSVGSYSGATCQQTFELQSNCRRHGPGHFHRERLGSYNESISYSENDDVFMPTTRNINSRTLPSSCNGVRRHSVGNFNNKERRCSSFSDEVPKMIAPKPPTVSPAKYRNSNRRKESCGGVNMDDILIVTAKHSERAILWANFLKNRFDKITKQRGRKPFNFLHIKIDDGPFSTEVAQKCQTTVLQIVVLCPALLALSHSYLMSQLSVILNPEKILGILLDVQEDKILEIHKNALPSFRKWRRCAVRDNDQSLIGNILGIATDILGRALCQRPPCQESNGINIKSSSTEAFTVVPRKVKIGQNKVLALLTEPLTKDDWVKITIEKSGEIIEVNNFKRRNPYTLQFTIPESCMEISTMVEIHIEKNNVDLGSRPVKCESRLRELEQLLRSQDSPVEFMCHSLGIGSTERDALDLHLLHCFQRNIPPNFHLLSGPSEKQNNILPIKDSSSEEYPTLLHFAAKWGLETLSMQLLECPGGDAACEIKNYLGKTPAEIAEQEGFHKLSKSLKSFSKIHEFTTMYHYFKGISDTNNSSKVILEPKTVDLPKTRVEKENSLSQQSLEEAKLQAEYMEMSSGSEGELSRPNTTLAVTNLNYINIESAEECNLQSSDELSKKADRIKIIAEPEIMSNELRINEPPYYQSNENNKADKFSQECSNLLENCSISSQSDYLVQPSNIPVISKDQGDYMTQPSNKPVEAVNYINSPPLSQNNYQECEDDDSHLRMNFERKRPKNGTLKRTGSDASKGNADDELAEIMYDFKNNVLTIREVEQLVEKWKNRNDVKQSFKEKQEQIERLREEYDRIQEQMKTRLKRPTPFERVKKLFSRNKSVIKQNSEDTDDAKSSVASFQSSQRPISSLSLQSVSSSSSSGRMSTASACSGTSLGDSGTHSDHEDRRQLFLPSCRVGSPGSLMDNYMIPPTPRPVNTPASTPTPVEEKDRIIFSNSTHRAISPTSPVEHYILFPSNVPVFSATNENQSHSHSNDAIPFSSLNTIEEAKETPNDVGVTVQPIKVQSNEKIYTQVTKNDICSSFKPLNSNSTLNSMVNFKKEMAEVYQNINSLDTKPTMSKDTKNICENCADTAPNTRNNDKSDVDHNYMNV